MADPFLNRGTAVAPSIEEFKQRWSVHQNYLVTLKVTGDKSLSDSGNFDVSTSLDESFAISLHSSWEAQAANVLAEMAGKNKYTNLAQQGMKGMGLTARSRYTSAQIWQSTDAVGFNIPFTFIAQVDAKKEVQDKVQALLKLTAPSMGGDAYKNIINNGAATSALNAAILKAPGPSIVDQFSGGRNIQLQIGNFLLLDNCIVESVDVQFDSIMGAQGIPHKAKATVEIKSFYTCFTVEDLDRLFINKG